MLTAEWVYLLILLAGAVGTILFWAAAVALAMAIGSAILLFLNFLWWLITRPIVWPIMAIRHLFRPRPERQIMEAMPSAGNAQLVHERTERLERLKALLDTGALSQAEFDRMKIEVLG